MQKKKSNAGRKPLYGEPTFVYGGVRIPLSWKGTNIMMEYRIGMQCLIAELIAKHTPREKKD